MQPRRASNAFNAVPATQTTLLSGLVLVNLQTKQITASKLVIRSLRVSMHATHYLARMACVKPDVQSSGLWGQLTALKTKLKQYM